MDTKTCNRCGTTYPNTIEFFDKAGYKRNGEPRYSLSCKYCKKEYREKIRGYHLDPEEAAMKAAMLDVEKIRPEKCSGNSYTLQEFGVCIHIGCRYHLIDIIRNKSLNKAMSVDQIVDRLMEMKYTCLWDLMEKEKTPLSQVEIAAILNVTNERIRQIEEEALQHIRENAKDLEDYLIEDVDPVYHKPPRVIGVDRISDWKIRKVWHNNEWVDK
jgi:hypothetical protein